nr:hypothetical protein [Tanacetum cinerariifolium]
MVVASSKFPPQNAGLDSLWLGGFSQPPVPNMVSNQCLQGWIQFPPLVSPDVDVGNEPPVNRKNEGIVPKLIEFSSSSRKRDVMDTYSLTQQVSSDAITQSTSDAFETDLRCIFPSGTTAKLIESSSSSGQRRMQIQLEPGGFPNVLHLKCTEYLCRNTDFGTRQHKRPTHENQAGSGLRVTCSHAVCGYVVGLADHSTKQSAHTQQDSQLV